MVWRLGAGMRFENWPERLNDFLSASHEFSWTDCNCALFAADGVESQTGKDFAKAYRGPKTKRGMISRLAKVCGGGVEDAATKELGEPLANILLAKRGDVVSFDYGDGPSLGLCNGAQGVFITENQGKIRVPLKACRMGWSVE